jgi:NAD(P)-dependent dehydrogenase (short-subunit alcohol dehydrogenase family)
MTLLLEGKRAIVYGAGGNVGGAVARALAREGARVHVTGRDLAKLESVAADIAAAGGEAEVGQVDALDREQVEAHAATVAAGGGIDISFNAIWIRGDLQGTPLLEMPVEDFLTPIEVAARSHFLTATAAARHMVERGSGVVIALSTTAARLPGRDERFHRTGGFGVACGAIETFSRALAGEVGPKGVRVLCLRSEALPETWPPMLGDDGSPVPLEDLPHGRFMIDGTVLGRLPRLTELADTAAFLASDRASAIARTVVNVNAGSVLD